MPPTPTSGIDLYQMQDARNNFDAMRPAPICADANQFMGQCQNRQNIHISMNCYYGFHDQKSVESSHVFTDDCEMVEVSNAQGPPKASASPQSNARKRSADDGDCPMTKRFREEVQREKSNEPETNEKLRMDARQEDLIETLYWNIHGGNMFHLYSVCEV